MNVPRTKLFLDVDGVINRYVDPTTEGVEVLRVAAQGLSGGIQTYTIHYSPAVVMVLDALIAEFDIELLWLTSWNANKAILHLVEELGMLRGGRLLPIPLPRMSGYPRRWKVQTLLRSQRQQEIPSAFLWVDDELGPHGKQAKNTFDVPSLLIQPDPSEGLTLSHLTAMRDFLEGPALRLLTPRAHLPTESLPAGKIEWRLSSTARSRRS